MTVQSAPVVACASYDALQLSILHYITMLVHNTKLIYTTVIFLMVSSSACLVLSCCHRCWQHSGPHTHGPISAFMALYQLTASSYDTVRRATIYIYIYKICEFRNITHAT